MAERRRIEPRRDDDELLDPEAVRIRDATYAARDDSHATPGGAAVTGALTGGAIGVTTGPIGAVVGAIGGAAAAVAAERAMHTDDEQNDPEWRAAQRRRGASVAPTAAPGFAPEADLETTRRMAAQANPPRPRSAAVPEAPVVERQPVVDRRPVGPMQAADTPLDLDAGDERTIRLREEELIAHKDLREVGEVVVRTIVEEVPGRVEVEALREEVQVEHVPVGQVVTERRAPWEEEGGDLVVPIYEEQLVVVKRLVLREQLRIRRVAARERQVFEDTLKRERLLVEDPEDTGLVHEQYADDADYGEPGDTRPRDERRRPAARQGERQEGGFLQDLVRKALT